MPPHSRPETLGSHKSVAGTVNTHTYHTNNVQMGTTITRSRARPSPEVGHDHDQKSGTTITKSRARPSPKVGHNHHQKSGMTITRSRARPIIIIITRSQVRPSPKQSTSRARSYSHYYSHSHYRSYSRSPSQMCLLFSFSSLHFGVYVVLVLKVWSRSGPPQVMSDR